MIEQYLDDLENRIDPGVEDQLLAEWKAFLDGELQSGFFSPRRPAPARPQIEWPHVLVNEALQDRERMALQQLAACSAVLTGGSGAILNIRTNYGTAIFPSLFGAETFYMDDELDTLPTSKPLAGGAEAIRQVVDRGVPDLDGGFGGKCFETAEYYMDLFRDYPNISKYVQIYHPDIQGPMDVSELLWGSEIFIGLMDDPELAHRLLALVTETYIQFMRRWEQIVPPEHTTVSSASLVTSTEDGSPEPSASIDDRVTGDGSGEPSYAGCRRSRCAAESPSCCSAHWGMMHKGRLMLRDDSAMNLSPDMFEQFIKPYDQQLLTEFGGGAIHFCGRGDHYIHHVADIDGVYAVNLSQPECNDMERIFQNTVDKGITLIGLRRDAAEEAMARGRELHGRVCCR